MEVGDVASGIRSKIGARRLAYIAADPSMWKVDGGPSHAETMLRNGVTLRRADNSRHAGYLEVRNRIAGDAEGPMLYATKNCHDGFWRTLPDIVMDESDSEDVDTENEDHAYDDVRYGCMSRPWVAVTQKRERIERDWFRDKQVEASWRTV
jgi:hypothetical protein